MDRYPIHRTIYDVTITSMGAGQLLVLDPTMQAGGVSYRTPNPIVPTSTATGGQVVVEVDSLEVIPPTQSNGAPVFGPIDVWPVVDGQEYRHYTDVVVDAALLGWPLHARTYGGSHLARLLGTPWWKLCAAGLAGHPVDNAPLKNSTIKYAQNFGLTIYSQTAWTAAPGYGLRIIVKGWIYDAQTVAYFAPGWQTSIDLQTQARDLLNQPALQTAAALAPTAIDFSTWQQLPGGAQQSNPKISPYIHYALNAQATTPGTRYVLSNETSVGGQSGHVATSYQDLGLNGPTAQLALWLKHYGITSVPGARPTNLARFGWLVDGTEIPENLNGSFAGFAVTDNVNDYFVGDVGPYLGDDGTGTGYAGKYRPIPAPDQEFLLFYKDTAAPFIGDNGTAIPANGVCVQIQGVLIEGVA